MIIRDVSTDDFKDLHKLSNLLGYNYSIYLLKENLTRIIKLKDHIIFVIENKENNVVGFAHAQIYDLIYFKRMANILGIVIENQYRRQGYGRKLMIRIEDWTRKNNCHGIRLTSNKKRNDAHIFYQKMDFISKKESKHFIKIF